MLTQTTNVQSSFVVIRCKGLLLKDKIHTVSLIQTKLHLWSQ